MLSIILIDDEPAITRDILGLYGYEAEVYTDGLSGLHAVLGGQRQFDVVILDVVMPVMDGWGVLKAIRSGQECPNIPIIMLTSMEGDEAMVKGLRRGADVYLPKPITPPVLLAHLEAIHRRLNWKGEAPSIETSDPESQEMMKLLTQREREILKCIVQGLTNQQISDTLSIAEPTVKNHLANIYRKLEVTNRTQAVLLAQKLHLI
jgi:DNA-binding NarL/FixJ family response regulator